VNAKSSAAPRLQRDASPYAQRIVGSESHHGFRLLAHVSTDCQPAVTLQHRLACVSPFRWSSQWRSLAGGGASRNQGQVSDGIGRAHVYFLLYAIQAIVLFILPHLTSVTLLSAALAVVGLCYGGGFGTMPSFTADFFGSKYMGGIYGWILLAWGAGAIPSPILIARLRQSTGRHDQAIVIVAIVMV
jgi:hypothetical protein